MALCNTPYLAVQTSVKVFYQTELIEESKEKKLYSSVLQEKNLFQKFFHSVPHIHCVLSVFKYSKILISKVALFISKYLISFMLLYKEIVLTSFSLKLTNPTIFTSQTCLGGH